MILVLFFVAIGTLFVCTVYCSFPPRYVKVGKGGDQLFLTCGLMPNSDDDGQYLVPGFDEATHNWDYLDPKPNSNLSPTDKWPQS